MNKTLLMFALITAGGCTLNTDKPYEDPFFPPKARVPHTAVIIERATDAGAAEDAQFHPVHFSGDDLNSLGRTKLDGIVRFASRLDPPAPLRLYVVPSDVDVARNAARRDALTRAVATAGLERHATVELGHNTSVTGRAENAIKALAAETESTSGTDADSSGPVEASAGAGMTP